jgi:hypothetical protein
MLLAFLSLAKINNVATLLEREREREREKVRRPFSSFFRPDVLWALLLGTFREKKPFIETSILKVKLFLRRKLAFYNICQVLKAK